MAGSESQGKSGESIYEEIRRAVKAPIDTNDFSFYYPKLENFLSSNDPVIVVLKGHIYLEYVLVRSISSHLPRPKAVDFDRMNFLGKVGLAKAFGIADLFLDACLVINKVRNKIAHRIDYELNEKDVDELVKAMPTVFHQSIAEYASKLGVNQSDDAVTSISMLRSCLENMIVLIECERIEKSREEEIILRRHKTLVPARDDRGNIIKE